MLESSRNSTLSLIEGDRYLTYYQLSDQADELMHFNLKKALKKVGGFVTDIGKGVAYVAASGVNSVTGHTYDPKFETKAGKALSGLTIQGTDSVHILGKTFADTISGGYATKLANTARSDENKERPGAYNESQMKTDGLLRKFETFSKAGAALIGKVMGNKALQNSGFKPPQSGTPQGSSDQDGGEYIQDIPYEELPNDAGSKEMTVAAVAIIIILIIVLT